MVNELKKLYFLLPQQGTLNGSNKYQANRMEKEGYYIKRLSTV